MQLQRTPWVVAIGASGGQGMDDIMELLGALPRSLAAVVLIVLHRSWDHPSDLRSILARISKLPVIIATEGELLEIGNVYIGEPAKHLTFGARSFGELIDDQKRHYINRTIDLLFGSVAAHAGDRVIGVILSGSLDDGSRGLASIHKAGGVTMVLTHSSPARNARERDRI